MTKKKLKGAYINIIRGSIAGVEKKLRDEAKVLKDLNVDVYILNTKVTKREDNMYYVNIYTLLPSYIPAVFKSFYFKVFRFIPIMLAHARGYMDIDDYDFLIIRYPLVGFFDLGFAKKYGSKMIIQHHTKETEELWLFISSLKTIKRFYPFLSEEYIAPCFFKHIRAIIGVTQEIIDYEVKRLSFKGPTFVMSNGIDVDAIGFTGFKPFDGRRLNMVFVASYFQPWQGLDILLDKLLCEEVSVEIILHLVGKLDGGDLGKIDRINESGRKAQVRVYGLKYGKELDAVFQEVNIGISSLALFRKDMQEACSLKSREYIARGLPFAYGYVDSDLGGDEEFALRVNPHNFRIKDLVKFAERVSKIPDLSQKMRKFAYDNLDWSVKWRRAYSFIKDVLMDSGNEQEL